EFIFQSHTSMSKRERGIKKLSTLFDTYKKTLKAPQGAVIDCFLEVLEELMGLSIKREYVRYTVHGRVLSVNAAGPIKSEIKLRKGEILAHMKGRLGEQN